MSPEKVERQIHISLSCWSHATWAQRDLPHILMGASSSSSIGWLIKISRALRQRYLISYSSSSTGFPGLDPRTTRINRQHIYQPRGKGCMRSPSNSLSMTLSKSTSGVCCSAMAAKSVQCCLRRWSSRKIIVSGLLKWWLKVQSEGAPSPPTHIDPRRGNDIASLVPHRAIFKMACCLTSNTKLQQRVSAARRYPRQGIADPMMHARNSPKSGLGIYSARLSMPFVYSLSTTECDSAIL